MNIGILLQKITANSFLSTLVYRLFVSLLLVLSLDVNVGRV